MEWLALVKMLTRLAVVLAAVLAFGGCAANKWNPEAARPAASTASARQNPDAAAKSASQSRPSLAPGQLRLVLRPGAEDGGSIVFNVNDGTPVRRENTKN